jgi:nucleoid DNA-binding protein
MPFFSSKTKNETIKHKEFVKLYAQKSGISEAEAATQISNFVETICDGIREQRPITVEHLGSFYLAIHKDSIAFKFNPAQKIKALLGWSNTYKGEI